MIEAFYATFAAPFVDYGFMRRALAACLALALGSGSIGVFLILRRMSLLGDAMSHALLPGVALGFAVGGLSLWAMTLGGLLAGLSVALLAGAVGRYTLLSEDAGFAGFYLIALALGVLLVSRGGGKIDLLHILFGSILSVDAPALYMVASIASLNVLVLAVIYRPLVLECFDPGFLRSVSGRGACYHMVFLVLTACQLVAGFQALGTLMSVGLMMLPAAAARFWSASAAGMIGIATTIAALSGYGGLLWSYHGGAPSGPAVVLCAGSAYVVSIAFGRYGGLLTPLLQRRHVTG